MSIPGRNGIRQGNTAVSSREPGSVRKDCPFESDATQHAEFGGFFGASWRSDSADKRPKQRLGIRQTADEDDDSGVAAGEEQADGLEGAKRSHLCIDMLENPSRRHRKARRSTVFGSIRRFLGCPLPRAPYVASIGGVAGMRPPGFFAEGNVLMGKGSVPSWAASADGSTLQVTGRIYGAEADAVRAAAQEGDSVMDAIKRVITIAIHHEEALQAAEARERAATARADAQASALTSMAKSYNALVKLADDLARHVQAMAAAQQQTAREASTIASDSGIVRSAAASFFEQATVPLVQLRADLDFLNQILDALASGAAVEPILAARAADTVSARA